MGPGASDVFALRAEGRVIHVLARFAIACWVLFIIGVIALGYRQARTADVTEARESEPVEPAPPRRANGTTGAPWNRKAAISRLRTIQRQHP